MNSLTAHLVQLASEVSGRDEEDILGKRRQVPLPACRWMIGEVLVSRGWPIATAARELNVVPATLRHGLEELATLRHDTNWGYVADIVERFRSLVASEA